VAVPLYESPDERAHVLYAETLAFDQDFPAIENTYEAWQPPLYYAIGAVGIRALGLEPAPDLPTDPAFPASAAVFQHPGEDFPYTSEELNVLLLRAVTIVFGAGVVVLTYLIAGVIFPGRRLLALVAGATAGLVPQYAFIGAMVSNDVPAAFFGALVAYCSLRILRDGRNPWLLLAGVALACGMLTKTTVAITAIFPVAAIVWSRSSWSDAAREVLVVAALPVLFAGWFYLRSVILWGDFYPADRFPTPLTPRGFGDPAWRTLFWEWLMDSYWYIGGYMNISFTSLPYTVFRLFPVLAAAGVIVGYRHDLLDQAQRRALGLLVALVILAVALVVYYSLTRDFQPQGRYLFIAQPAIATLLTYGIGTLFTRDSGRDHPAMLVLPALLTLTNIWILTVKLPGVY
jgi:4-amino-4-deoxy-L-arabinose transferase-like glycosyltransferase